MELLRSRSSLVWEYHPKRIIWLNFKVVANALLTGNKILRILKSNGTNPIAIPVAAVG